VRKTEGKGATECKTFHRFLFSFLFLKKKKNNRIKLRGKKRKILLITRNLKKNKKIKFVIPPSLILKKEIRGSWALWLRLIKKQD
jgi:hypothetical protein